MINKEKFIRKIRIGRLSTFGGRLLIYAFLTGISYLLLFPFLYMVVTSVKNYSDLYDFTVKWVPHEFHWQNYAIAYNLLNYWNHFGNSLMLTTVCTLGHLLSASFIAYGFARYSFPGKKILFQTVVLSLLFSTVVTGIPNYIIITKLHMINTVWALILPLLPSSLGLFLMKQFMDQMIPDTLLEAARLDGAGENRIFFSICLPLVKPAIMTLLIYSFQGIWNSTGGSYIFDEKLKTLPTALNNIITSGISRTGVSSAVSLLLILPPIAVFLFAQSNVLQTMATSGMKD